MVGFRNGIEQKNLYYTYTARAMTTTWHNRLSNCKDCNWYNNKHAVQCVICDPSLPVVRIELEKYYIKQDETTQGRVCMG